MKFMIQEKAIYLYVGRILRISQNQGPDPLNFSQFNTSNRPILYL